MSLTKRIKGDFVIESVDSGDKLIINQSGGITISGNLTVQGTTTTVESIDVAIVDNTIVLNSGELGSGITHPDAASGIEIDRGLLGNAGFRYNETSNKWEINDGSGSWSIVSAAGSTLLSDLADVILAAPAANEVLTFDGTNWINQPVAPAGLQNVVEDLTPQLGGDLDVQTFSIITTDTVEALAGSVTIKAGTAAGNNGGGVNITAGDNSAAASNGAGGSINITAGDSAYTGLAAVVGANVVITAGSAASGLSSPGNVVLEAGSGGTGSGTVRIQGPGDASPGRLAISDGSANQVIVTVPALVADTSFTLPPDNGTAGYLLSTDGAGTTTWITPPPTGIVAPQYEKQVIAGTPTVINTIVPTTSATGGSATLQVYRNGQLQEENISGGAITSEDFDVTGTNQLTFATALVNNDKIIIYSFE